MPRYIDIHSHVNFKAFDLDRDEVIRRALAGDTWVINVGTQVDTSKSAIELAHKYPEGVYAIVGLHPIHTSASYHDEQELGEGNKEFTSRGETFDKNVYKEFLKDKKVVAIGECGLDYYHAEEPLIDRQRKAFIEQIELANEFNKPLMLHVRNAYMDALAILKEHAKVKGVAHFFTGTWEEAKAYLDFGFMISFAGAITFPPKKDGTGAHTYEVVKNTPLNMILTDTDSPYVAPVPYRGKRNEPVYVSEIVKKIAEIKGLPEKEVADAIILNAKRLFDI
jgi:TatD DNase family protein